MKFTDDEKEVIKNALNRHLKEVQEVKKFPNQDFAIYKTEVEFEALVKGILKKLDE